MSALHGLVLDGYVRVSHVGKRRGLRFISPAVQRDEIAAWADAQDARLGTVFVELDESGVRPNRPLLTEAVERIEHGISQGLVVWRVDRFARSLIDGAQIMQRVRAVGGRFFSVRDGLDTGTDSGRMVLHILLSKAEWDLERIRDAWDIAHERAVARGAYPMAYTPVGYVRTATGRLRPHPETAVLVTDLYELRAHGHSINGLCDWLESRGVKTARGNAGWCSASLTGMLGRRVYLGEVVWGPYFHPRAHPALTDPATWELAQRPIRNVPKRSARYASLPAALLSYGLARCASCSMSLATVRRRRNGRDVREYCCRGRTAGGACPGPASITGDWLEPYVETAALDLLRRRRRPPTGALQQAERQLAEADAALSSYRDNERVRRTIGDDAFVSGLRVRSDRIRDARLLVAATRERLATHALPPAHEVEMSWPSLDADAKRAIVLRLIDCVFVAPGRTAPEERVTVCPTGTAPARLPHGGDRRSRSRPFVPRRSLRSPGNQTRFLWSTTRIESELRDYVRGRAIWPTAAQFISAGQLRLHQQIVLQHGEHWWALRFRLPFPHGESPRAPWTPERIAAVLDAYLAGKARWPTGAQFHADGMQSLYNASSSHGGIPYWRSRYAHLERRADQRNGEPWWTEARVRAHLERLCDGRDTFPTRSTFLQADERSLYGAITSQGGIARWATEMRLPLNPRSRGRRHRSRPLLGD